MAGKGSDKWANAAHIKKGTKGSFNQVSFSVLDAASRAAESEQGEAPHKLLGVIPLFTLNGNKAAGPSVLSRSLLPSRHQTDGTSQAGEGHEPAHQRPKGESLSALAKGNASSLAPFEIKAAEKQSARFHRRGIIVGLLALMVVGFIGFATLNVVEEPENQKDRATMVNQALSLVADADQDLIALNEALADPTSEASQAAFEDLSKKLPQTRIALQRAQSLAMQGSGDVLDSRGNEIAKRAQNAAEARIAMVDAGQALSSQIVGAVTAAQKLEQAWALMVESDASARNASALLPNPSEQNLARAKELMQQATDKLGQAIQAVDQAKQATDEDISVYADYAQARKEALDAAQAAINALIDKNVAQARTEQERYAQADASAASLAQQLPQDPRAFVFQGYQENAAHFISEYGQARSKAGFADSMLREYYASLHK